MWNRDAWHRRCKPHGDSAATGQVTRLLPGQLDSTQPARVAAAFNDGDCTCGRKSISPGNAYQDCGLGLSALVAGRYVDRGLCGNALRAYRQHEHPLYLVLDPTQAADCGGSCLSRAPAPNLNKNRASPMACRPFP